MGDLFLEDKDEDKGDKEEDKREMDATTVFRGSNNPNVPPKCEQPNHPFNSNSHCVFYVRVELSTPEVVFLCYHHLILLWEGIIFWWYILV